MPIAATTSSSSPVPAPATQASIDAFCADYAAARAQLGRVIVGQHGTVDGVLTCLFCNGHALLEGAPGLGKTLLVKTLSSVLGLEFSRVQFTPDLMPSDITGSTVVDVAADGSRGFRFQEGPVFTQLLLADEINRATPKTQSALLEAMEERTVTAAGQTRPLPSPFLVMATQNPLEQEGAYPLPEAQLDRFLFKILTPSPTGAELSQILDRTTGAEVSVAEPVLNAGQISSHQSLVRRVAVPSFVRDYAVRLTLSTHPTKSDAAPSIAPMVSEYVAYGASPRGAQALLQSAKCRALADGRPSVSVDDIKSVAGPALRHRVLLNFQAHAEGVTGDAVVERLIATLASPSAG